MDAIIQEIIAERQRQDEKWGEQNHPDEWWLPILLEEVGETSKAMLEVQFGMGGHGDVRKELVEAVAVGIAWLECIERNK